MKVVHTFEDVRGLSDGRTGLVPTMGFLHEGHLSLIEAASDIDDTVIVSIFVNPTQFNESSDLDAYPRDIERDLVLAERAGADIVFAPAVEHVYPSGVRVDVTVHDVADSMEGAHRPGHFRGVATVVAKLFAGLQPETAYFGRKDAQQLAVIETMVRGLSLPVSVRGLPIVREEDGLALSSRNVLINPDLRNSALALGGSLFRAADLFEAGERTSSKLVDVVEGCLGSSQDLSVEYVEVARSSDAAHVSVVNETSFIALAAHLGDVRLIDNVYLYPETGVADRGTRLSSGSILYGGS